MQSKMGSKEAANKPHAVCIPLPSQSHIKGMLKFAKLLHYKGFHITFVNTDFNHKRFLKFQGPNSLDGLPDFRFETIPDGLPNSDSDASQDNHLLLKSISKNLTAPFRDILIKLNNADTKATSNNSTPPVTCIISDGSLPFTTQVAEQLGIPITLFHTFSACSIMGFKQYPALVEKGIAPLKGEIHLTVEAKQLVN